MVNKNTIAQRKAKIRADVLKKHSRATKEKYIEGMGFIDMNYIRKMDDKEINDLVDMGMRAKGF